MELDQRPVFNDLKKSDLRNFGFSLLLISTCSFTSCLTTRYLEVKKSNAINFLNEHVRELDVGLVYSYLQQNNDLKELESQKRLRSRFSELSNLDSLSTNDESEFKTLNYFWRLVETEYQLDSALFYSAQGMDSITIQGLYCDQFAIEPKSFSEMLDGLMLKSDYHQSHALLCLNFAEKNECFSQKFISENKERLGPYFYKLLEKHEDINDIRIETLAFLLEAQMDYKKRWVKQIMKAQQKDGGWKGNKSSSNSNSHSTILAVWLIQNVINDLEN